jgi:hypothetical protein
MKKISLLLLICFLSIKINSQSSFEGYIDYSVKIEVIGDSIFNGINKQQLINKLKEEGVLPNDTVTYFYSKTGDYLSIFKVGEVSIVNTYLSSRKLLFTFLGESDIVSAIDVTIDVEEKMGFKPQIKLLENNVRVGNYDCRCVEIIWKSGSYRYYYSPDFLEIDPQLYLGYQYDQWYNYLKISGVLPVAIEKRVNNLYKVTYVLGKYLHYELDKSMFELPEMKEEKSFSNINKRTFILE